MIKPVLSIFNVILFLVVSYGQESFSFVQICDTQLGFGGYEHDIQSFNEVVDQINELKPAFAVICGDLVNDANESSFRDFKTIVNRLEVPIHLAPGNHDVGGEPTDSTLEAYRNMIGPDYFHFQYHQNAFVIVNTQLWKVDVPNESRKHHSWFKETLNQFKSDGIPTYVIGHYPLYTDHPQEEEHYFSLPKKKRQEILSDFKANGVVAYMSGHLHRRVINTNEGILLVGGASCSKNFDDTPLGYRLWTITESKVNHEFIALPEYLQHEIKTE